MFTGSTIVRNVDSEPQDNRTLVLSWQVPSPSNGDILAYTIRVFMYDDGGVLSEENVTNTTYTATNLSKVIDKI